MVEVQPIKKEEVSAPKVVVATPVKEVAPVVATPVVSPPPTSALPVKTPLVSSPAPLPSVSPTPLSNNSSKKLWFIVGGAALLVIILLLGGYFVAKAISSSSDSSSNSSSESNLTLIPTTQGEGENAVTVDDGSTLYTPPFGRNFSEGSTTNDSGTAADDGSTTNNSSNETSSYDDLLRDLGNASNSSSNSSSSTELSVSVTSLTCSVDTFVFDLLVNSGSFEAIVFSVKDGSVSYPFSEWITLGPGQTHTFSLALGGQPLNLGSASLEVHSWNPGGDEVLLATRAC
jgi:hypothetical protein